MTNNAPVVLLVTADDSAREFSALVLAHSGVRVEHAHSGDQGFEKADELLPDAVVVHLSMSGLGGSELHQRLRAHPRTRSIPILVVKGSPRAWLDAVNIVSRVVRWRRPSPDDVAGTQQPVTLH